MDHLRAAHFFSVRYMLACRRELLHVPPTTMRLINHTGKAK
jgi:hypothetical protein